MAKKMTIDQGFDSLEEIIEKMESDNISLEESFQLYGKGIEMIKQLKEKLPSWSLTYSSKRLVSAS